MTGYLTVSLFVSAMLLAAVWFTWGTSRKFVIFAALLVACFLAASMQSKALGFQIGLTIVVLGLCGVAGARLNAQRLAALAAMIVAYGIVIQEGLNNSDRLADLRDHYPIESVADRLEYETVRPTTGAVKLSSEVEQRLEAAEYRGFNTHRGDALHRVYASTTRDVTLASFGPRWLGVNVIDVPTPRSISLSDPPPRSGGCAPPPVPEYVPQPAQPDDSATPYIAMRTMHNDGAGDFLNPERFGFVKDREHVAGFEPHAFQAMPMFGSHRTTQGEWKLEHLELVSLMKPRGPYVYLSENLPKLDELNKADTRMLDDFETRALSQLRSKEDIVIEESGDTVRMIGALRAGNHCIRCHSAQRGELIGAFSYEFLRQEPPPEAVARAHEPPQT